MTDDRKGGDNEVNGSAREGEIMGERDELRKVSNKRRNY